MKYIKNTEIKYDKWDSCITNSPNGLIYGYSWYLDAVCESWDAIIQDDYEIIMPIPYYFNYKLKQIYNPICTPRLGIFYSKKIAKTEIEKFILSIPFSFKEININLNKFNDFSNKNWSITKKKYYSLDLIQSYSKLYSEFSYSIKKNIKKAESQNYSLNKGIAPKEIISFLRKNNYLQNEDDYNYLRRLISFSLMKKFSFSFAAYNNKNILSGIAFFIFSHQNANLIILKTQKEEADHELVTSLLINKFLEINTEKDITLNFEDDFSEETINIIKNFGAKEYLYKSISKIHSHKFFNWFKKRKK